MQSQPNRQNCTFAFHEYLFSDGGYTIDNLISNDNSTQISDNLTVITDGTKEEQEKEEKGKKAGNEETKEGEGENDDGEVTEKWIDEETGEDEETVEVDNELEDESSSSDDENKEFSILPYIISVKPTQSSDKTVTSNAELGKDSSTEEGEKGDSTEGGDKGEKGSDQETNKDKAEEEKEKQRKEEQEGETLKEKEEGEVNKDKAEEEKQTKEEQEGETLKEKEEKEVSDQFESVDLKKQALELKPTSCEALLQLTTDISSGVFTLYKLNGDGYKTACKMVSV